MRSYSGLGSLRSGAGTLPWGDWLPDNRLRFLFLVRRWGVAGDSLCNTLRKFLLLHFSNPLLHHYGIVLALFIKTFKCVVFDQRFRIQRTLFDKLNSLLIIVHKPLRSLQAERALVR